MISSEAKQFIALAIGLLIGLFMLLMALGSMRIFSNKDFSSLNETDEQDEIDREFLIQNDLEYEERKGNK